MPPKHRSSSSGALRAHSRSSSASKLGANLQLTSNTVYAGQKAEKGKKTGHETHSRNASPLPRTQSAVRVDPREPHLAKRPAAPPTTTTSTVNNAKTHGSKLKGAFTINLDDDDDDDDAWVSSESGADTPNRFPESSGTDSDSETTVATPIARETVMRGLRSMKRTAPSGSTQWPNLATIKSTSQAPPVAQTEQRVSQMGTKGPPSPISPNPVPPSHSAPSARQQQQMSAAPHTQGHNGPPHLTADEARALRQRQQVQYAEVERQQHRIDSDRAQSEFPHAQKVNGTPALSRLPAPGQFLESQSRAGHTRPMSSRGFGDLPPMEPTAAACFAQAIASQDADADEIAAALSKPSSPNIREGRMHGNHRLTPSESSAARHRSNGFKTDVSDHRRHSSLAVGSNLVHSAGSTSPKSKHHSSRPSSVYSVNSKHLRPHPLIRGQRNAGVPLAPLSVLPEPQLSRSLPEDDDFPPSPASLSSAPSSPDGPSNGHRRSSISSARSVATLPLPQTNKDARRGDRSRTLSTISSSATIAVLANLVHHPTMPVHRILFPQLQEEDLRKIHALPHPRVTQSHLQYIAHRSPLRESYDRVMRAKVGKT